MVFSVLTVKLKREVVRAFQYWYAIIQRIANETRNKKNYFFFIQFMHYNRNRL